MKTQKLSAEAEVRARLAAIREDAQALVLAFQAIVAEAIEDADPYVDVKRIVDQWVAAEVLPAERTVMAWLERRRNTRKEA